MRIKVWSAAAAVLLLAACGGPKPQESQEPPQSAAKTGTPPDISNITINGNAEDPVNKIVMQAIADLQQYWGEEYPKLYNSDFKPVSGGYFAVYPSAGGPPPPCSNEASDIAGNAYYCSTEDVVAWDAEGLLPELRSKFGDFVIPVVLAHEFGHAVQSRSNFTARTVTGELQADCFAGAWSKHAQDTKVFDVTAANLDDALAGVLELRDSPGSSKIDPDAHGSGFDRVSAFQDGYDNGAEKCKDYRDDEPMVLELPFSTAEDAAAKGNAPYDYIVQAVPYDLEDYWTHVYPEVANGQPWQPVRELKPFEANNPPTCDGESDEGWSLFYCVPEDYIAWDNTVDMPEVYRQGGDYAVATLLATQFSLAALDRLKDESDEKTSTLRGDCLTGAYTASVIIHNRPETSTFDISPGDLDEAITALLVERGEGDAERQGSGFARVRAFREGVLNGAHPCLGYQV